MCPKRKDLTTAKRGKTLKKQTSFVLSLKDQSLTFSPFDAHHRAFCCVGRCPRGDCGTTYASKPSAQAGAFRHLGVRHRRRPTELQKSMSLVVDLLVAGAWCGVGAVQNADDQGRRMGGTVSRHVFCNVLIPHVIRLTHVYVFSKTCVVWMKLKNPPKWKKRKKMSQLNIHCVPG